MITLARFGWPQPHLSLNNVTFPFRCHNTTENTAITLAPNFNVLSADLFADKVVTIRETCDVHVAIPVYQEGQWE